MSYARIKAHHEPCEACGCEGHTLCHVCGCRPLDLEEAIVTPDVEDPDGPYENVFTALKGA